ncbi:MAG: hypothetical protein KA131_15700, partial [Thauera sp.]|nr:hypothetical protein [Thauera sp.]
ERFTKLSAKVSKTLPQLEPAHMDFERERLSLIVESIDEPAERKRPPLPRPLTLAQRRAF